MISVLILTKNESLDLAGCLASVAWSDDIHVFDSFSSDETIAIAQAHGVNVTQRVFDNYAAQRNAALHSLLFKYDWVLILDADERVPQPLREELAAFVANPAPDVVACRLRRRDFFFGRHLAHAQISPFYIRLVQPLKVHYEREVNEVLKADGKVEGLHEPFDHYPFSKGIAHWFDKHNCYSTMEAQQVVQTRRGNVPFSPAKAFFCEDFNERRFHQKEIFYRLPARPLIKWLYIMLLRRAFLDGAPGVAYAFLQAIYEYMIVLKTRELEMQTEQPALTQPQGHASPTRPV